ncbi:MAG: methionine adenosyltransferase [Christensenellaceae bacterium]|nr:methionine adenosyltransferase [Christensenellaceae bacterium]MDY2850936.1 methionine adenosyltransferase [Christensenellaceae bacterium]
MNKFFTSESVTEGHPDKICDRISDAVLDAIIENDPNARVACECCTATGLVLIMGEITTESYVDIQKIAKDEIREIGYTNSSYGFDADTCAVITTINSQSPDIALGVNDSVEHRSSGDEIDRIGAGDQGMMFGYACNETEEYMPMAITLAHKLTRRLTEVRKSGLLPYLRPDGKSQVTVEYDGKKVKRIEAVVVSTQHSEEISTDQLRKDVKKYVIEAVLPENLLDENTKYFINPTGRFEIGGPHGDSGLTGRKIIVDTYGGSCPHGGGAFSGKDPTKVDRSAAYMARYVCKNIVAAGLADECTLEVAYAIGVAKPVSLYINTNGTGKLPDSKIAEIVEKEFDLRPAAIIKTLDLLKPIYKQTSSYGHFGRSEFSWEKLDRTDDLKKYLNK